MAMSKRKRERLDVGMNNGQKKPKPSRKERGATLTGKHEGLGGKKAEDKDTVAVAVDSGAELEPVKGTDKEKSTNTQEDSDGEKAVIQMAPLTNDTSQTMAQPENASASHERLEQRVAKLERRKGKRMKIGEHQKGTEEVSSQRKSSRRKGRMRSKNEKPFWRVSDATGGQMLDLDPIFTLNEEYINFFLRLDVIG